MSPTTKKSPEKRVPPAERMTDSAYHGLGRSGSTPWPWMRSLRSASIDSPMLPAMPSRDLRNDVIITMRPSRNITAVVNTALLVKVGTLGRARVSSTRL